MMLSSKRYPLFQSLQILFFMLFFSYSVIRAEEYSSEMPFNSPVRQPDQLIHAAQEPAPTWHESAPVSSVLYRIDCKTMLPVTNLTIGEFSTNQPLARWSAPDRLHSTGTYSLTGPSAEKFLLSIQDSGDGGQMLTIYSAYANQLLMKLRYVSGVMEEKMAGPPQAVFNCTLNTVESCTPGYAVTAPYSECSRQFAGFVELVITDFGGTLDDFNQNVMNPLESASEWEASNVWNYLFRKIDKGYYAEVRVTTNLCTRAVAQKLQGNPSILSETGRQVSVHY
jgi:hypothetical protein